ncbi:MAG: Arsenical pump-driving ATPase, partial [uncultured Solirubrobacterales bacterium]
GDPARARVHLRHRQGRRRQDHGRRRARARRGGSGAAYRGLRGRRPAPAVARVRRLAAVPRSRGSARSGPVDDLDRARRRAPPLARGSAAFAGAGGPAVSHAGVRLLHRGGAGGSGGGDPRSGLEPGPAGALGRQAGRLRHRDRRCSGLGPRSRDAAHAADLRRHSPGRHDPPPGGPSPSAGHRSRACGVRDRRASRGDAGDRDPRARDAARGGGRHGPGGDRGQRPALAALLGRRARAARRDDAERRAARARGCARRCSAPGQPRPGPAGAAAPPAPRGARAGAHASAAARRRARSGRTRAARARARAKAL